MEVRPIIDLDWEATPDQMNTLMDGAESSLDHVVFDTLIPDQGYAGMVVSYTGTTITVGTGRLYQGGKVYAFDTVQTIDVLSKLPVATKKKLFIVAYGTEADTDEGPVNVLIEAQSTPTAPVYQEQTVAQNHRRLAVVQPAYGDEGPNPPDPGYGLALPIAVATLGPTGIIDLANSEGNKAPNLADVEARVTALETWESVIGPQVSSLASDLASLSNALKNSTSQALIGRMLVDIASLDAKVGIPTNAADSSADYLLDGSNSDLTNVLSACNVMEGVRFPWDGYNPSVLNLFNPFETAGVVKGGVLLPTYTRYLRGATGQATDSIRADAYTYNTVNYTLQTMTQQRTRYGTPFDVCTNSAFWNTPGATYDPYTSIFTLPGGQTYRVASEALQPGQVGDIGWIYGTDGRVITHEALRLTQFWTDSLSTNYWAATVQAPQTIPGYHIFESYQTGQDHWIDAIGVWVASLDSQGDITLVITEAGDNAQPIPTRVLAKTTIPFASLKVGENVFGLTTPIFTRAGQRVSIGIITTGAHRIYTTPGASFPQGTMFELAPSGFAQGDLTKHLCLYFYGCKFNQPVTSIQLQNLQLSGGITGIDVQAPMVVPDSTTAVWEIQLAGVWVPLNASNVAQLNAGGSLPPNVPIRITFTGTVDVMPCVDLAHSIARVMRPALLGAHVWPKLPRTPPVSSASIRVIERYEGFNSAHHSAGCKLLTGAGYTTQTSPSSFSDAPDPNDPNAIVRTYVFNLGAAVASYKVLSNMTTTTALDPYLIAWIKDYVL